MRLQDSIRIRTLRRSPEPAVMGDGFASAEPLEPTAWMV